MNNFTKLFRSIFIGLSFSILCVFVLGTKSKAQSAPKPVIPSQSQSLESKAQSVPKPVIPSQSQSPKARLSFTAAHSLRSINPDGLYNIISI